MLCGVSAERMRSTSATTTRDTDKIIKKWKQHIPSEVEKVYLARILYVLNLSTTWSDTVIITAVSITENVSYHRFCKHMCAQAITSRSITFATTRNTCAAKMSKIVSSLGHRAVLVSVECTRYTRALWRTLALYHGVQVTLRFWTFFQHLCLVWLLIVKKFSAWQCCM